MSICAICQGVIFGRKGQVIDGFNFHDKCVLKYTDSLIYFRAYPGLWTCFGCEGTGYEYVKSLGAYWHPKCLRCSVENYFRIPEVWREANKPTIFSRM